MLPPKPSIADRCQALISRPGFDSAILVAIIVNAVVLGLGTYGDLQGRYGQLFNALNWAILAIYVAELLIRLTAARWSPKRFAEDPWNVFDFIVVVGALVPVWNMRNYAMLLRLLRLLRIVRIIRFLPELRMVVSAIGRSIRGVASLAGATLLLVYFYGMVGWALFGQHSDAYADVGQAMLTMFVMLTFSNLADMVEMGQQVSDWAVIYFISYTVIVGFLIFNLFVGIVLEAMREARVEEREEEGEGDLMARLEAARIALEDAQSELEKTHRNDR